MILRPICLLWPLTLTLVALGCGDGKPPPGPPMAKPSPVRGRVVFANKSPLRGGVIYFTPVDVKAGGQVRYQGASLVDAKGQFTIGFNGDGKGVPPGDYKVTVEPRELNELRNSNSKLIPQVYREAATTPMMVTVKDQENVVDVELR
jgi:hypothetical protein